MKDFAPWHQIKTILENRENSAYFHERDIWLASTGLNLGHEQDGKNRKFLRPVAITRKFSNDIFWAVPLSSQHKNNPYFCYPIESSLRDSYAVPSQMRAMDRKRLFKKIGELSSADFQGLRQTLIAFLE